MATLAELTTERDALAARLDAGWTKIDAAQAGGRDVAGLEDFWLGLLRTYEHCCDQIEAEQRKPLVQHRRLAGVR